MLASARQAVSVGAQLVAFRHACNSRRPASRRAGGRTQLPAPGQQLGWGIGQAATMADCRLPRLRRHTVWRSAEWSGAPLRAAALCRLLHSRHIVVIHELATLVPLLTDTPLCVLPCLAWLPGWLQFKFVVDKVWTPAPHEPTVTNAEVRQGLRRRSGVQWNVCMVIAAGRFLGPGCSGRYSLSGMMCGRPAGGGRPKDGGGETAAARLWNQRWVHRLALHGNGT